MDLPLVGVFERKQIERAIGKRQRYRYVRPTVSATPEGMEPAGILVQSPCCSRRVEPGGGVVDVAVLHRTPSGAWHLYHKDHSSARWLLHSVHERLTDLLEPLKEDPERIFWQ
jgi:hypothetical protein